MGNAQGTGSIGERLLFFGLGLVTGAVVGAGTMYLLGGTDSAPPQEREQARATDGADEDTAAPLGTIPGDDEAPSGASVTNYYAQFAEGGSELHVCLEGQTFKEGTSPERWTKAKNARTQPPEAGLVLLDRPCAQEFSGGELLGPCGKWVRKDGAYVIRDVLYYTKSAIEEDHQETLEQHDGNHVAALKAICADDDSTWLGE